MGTAALKELVSAHKEMGTSLNAFQPLFFPGSLGTFLSLVVG